MDARRLWRVGMAGLALGVLTVAAGSTIGADPGLLAAGYGLLVCVLACYVLVAFAIGNRVRRRLAAPDPRDANLRHNLQARRVF